MNIGIDARLLTKNKAGIGHYIYEIIKELNKIDKSNNYFLYSHKKIYTDLELGNNWKICEYKSKSGTYFVRRKLPKIIKRDNIDVFWGTQYCLPKRNRKTKNIRFVVTIHDLAIEKFKGLGTFYNTLVHKLILNKTLKDADRIIAVSKATKNDLIELKNIDSNKICVIYEGVCSNETVLSNKEELEIKNKYGIRNGERFIFFLSTIEPRKNLETIIKAFELYKDEYKNDNLKFIISGGVGWKCNKALSMIKKSKYNSDIIMTGYINDKEKKCLFKNCLCYIYPSLYEGFGLPVLEALKNNCIVITTNVSSLPEVGGDAVLYLNNATDYIELKNLIVQINTFSEIMLQEYIKKGNEQVALFSWEKCAKETLVLFTEKK